MGQASAGPRSHIDQDPHTLILIPPDPEGRDATLRMTDKGCIRETYLTDVPFLPIPDVDDADRHLHTYRSQHNPLHDRRALSQRVGRTERIPDEPPRKYVVPEETISGTIEGVPG